MSTRGASTGWGRPCPRCVPAVAVAAATAPYTAGLRRWGSRAATPVRQYDSNRSKCVALVYRRGRPFLCGNAAVRPPAVLHSSPSLPVAKAEAARRYPDRRLVDLAGCQSEDARRRLVSQAAAERGRHEDGGCLHRSYHPPAAAHFHGFWADEQEEGRGDHAHVSHQGGVGVPHSRPPRALPAAAASS